MGRANTTMRLVLVVAASSVVMAATTAASSSDPSSGSAGSPAASPAASAAASPMGVARLRLPETAAPTTLGATDTVRWPSASTGSAVPTWRPLRPTSTAPAAAPGTTDRPPSGPSIEFQIDDRAPSADVPAQRVAPPMRSVLVAFGGDILNENAVNQAAADAAAAAGLGQRYEFGPLFSPPVAPVAEVIAAADLAVCHAELPIGNPGERPGVYGRSAFGGNLLLAPYELAPGLAAAGFDRCSTASNHSFDLGVPGIVSTLDAFDDVGITHTGTARSAEESAVTTDVFEVNGVLLAHLSYTRSSNTSPPRDPWMLDRATSVELVAADVAAVRAVGAELVIVSIHLGAEMQPGPTGGDRDFATRVTAGADVDLVIHHGPHVVQPAELVNGVWVYWSLGNFVSGMGLAHQGRYADQRTLDGLLATVRFTETEAGVFTAESRPVLLCNSRRDRAVHAPVALLADPVAAAAIDPSRRAELQACLDRTRKVQPELF